MRSDHDDNDNDDDVDKDNHHSNVNTSKLAVRRRLFRMYNRILLALYMKDLCLLLY